MEKSELISQLASSQNRRDEVPNQLLAKKIVESSNKVAIASLMELLTSGTIKIKKDCIKVVYEIGKQQPSLIAEHAGDFIALLDTKDNRLQWGAMTAIDCITMLRPDFIFENLVKIIETAERGSVITKDHAIEIMVKLGKFDKYNNMVVPILIELLANSPINQFPKYAERIFSVINDSSKIRFQGVLTEMLGELDTDSKRKRVNKILKKMS